MEEIHQFRQTFHLAACLPTAYVVQPAIKQKLITVLFHGKINRRDESAPENGESIKKLFRSTNAPRGWGN